MSFNLSIKVIQYLIGFNIIQAISPIKIPIAKEDWLSATISKCILDIAKRDFPRDSPLVVHGSNTAYCDKKQTSSFDLDQLVFKQLHAAGQYQIVSFGCLEDFTSPEVIHLKPASVILILPDLSRSTLNTVTYVYLSRVVSKFQNLNMKVLVISSNIENKIEGTVFSATSILNSIWITYGIENAIVLIPGLYTYTEKKITSLDVFYWIPEDQNLCIRQISKIKHLDHWLASESTFSRNANLFPVKDYNNFHGCTLILSFYSQPPFTYLYENTDNGLMYAGLFESIFSSIGKHLNISFHVRDASQNEDFDIKFPLTVGPSAILDKCHVSYPYFKISMKWYLHVQHLPTWKSVIKVFQPDMWLLVTVSYLLAVLTFWLFSNLEKRKVTFVEILFEKMKTFLASPVKAVGRGFTFSAFFILWLYYSMMIYTAYQSSLIGFITNPGVYNPISTQEQLDKSGYERWCFSRFINSSDPEENVWNTYEYCNWNTCFDGLNNRTHLAVLGNEYVFDYLSEKYKTPHGTSSIVKVDDFVKHYYLTSYFKLGCLFLKRFDSLTHRFVSAGMTDKWIRDFGADYWSSYWYVKDSSPQPIYLSQLQGPFAVLICGAILSVVAFIIEIISTCFIKRRVF